MGFLDALGDSVSVVSGGVSRPSRKHSSKSHHKKRRSHSHSRSRSSSRHRRRDRDRDHDRGAASIAGSIFGLGDSNYNKHNSSRASFFGLGNTSRSSFFGKPSYYKRSPRGNFMQRAYKQLKRILRDLVHYAKRHPWKVFFLVIMPLITGGALTALLARFGLRIPPALERMIGMASRAATGDHLGLVNDAVRMAGDIGGGTASVKVERGYDGGMQWERSTGHAQNDFISEGFKSVSKFFS
ncbi:hypothetical protein B0I35DRAFT_25787 [Stachybotrys elegans]|uniref:Uncharacterized protein n=1 Tax=Stachybotrys elegans TaxID=80388 RepID=A0A8K0WYC2_9HYPO|nr:hypothetical protein B0I35DRAFT_25787 [Stachybotrys elegans]